MQGLNCSMVVGSFWIRDGTCVSCTGRWILYHWLIKEANSQSFEHNYDKTRQHTCMGESLDPWKQKIHEGSILKATSSRLPLSLNHFVFLYVLSIPLCPLIFMLCAFLLLLSYNHALRVFVCIRLCVCMWTNTPVSAVYSFSILLYLIINILIEWLFK